MPKNHRATHALDHRTAASPRPIRTSTLAKTLVGVTAALTLAACGSGGDDKASAATTQVSSDVTAAVDAAKAEQTTWTGPTQPVNAPTGKKIVSIACSSTAPGCVNAGNGAKEAGSVLGWDVTVVDGKGDPNTWNSAIEQAVSDGADGIILNAVPPALVQGGLAQAKKAGVPVALTYIPSYDGPKVDAYVTSDHAQSGEYAADWVAAASKGKGKLLVLQEPQFAELKERDTAFTAKLKTSCPGCTIVKTAEFNLGTMPQQVPGLVSSALQANPDINFVVVPFDGAALFASQGIAQAGRSGVGLVGFEGDPDGLARVVAGTQSADVATVQPWMGWAAVDALARLMDGQTVKQQQVPQRLFDKTNAPKGDKGWVGDIDYRAKYRALWGK